MKSASDQLIEAGVAARVIEHFKAQAHGRTVNNCTFTAMYDAEQKIWLVKMTHRKCARQSLCIVYMHVRQTPETMHGERGLSAEQFAVVQKVHVPYVFNW